MSDDEKRAFIESLARPVKEKREFYRWQTKDYQNILLEAGEFTPEMYEASKSYHALGKGLYVAGDIFSSLGVAEGETLVKVEVDPGVKFIDLLSVEKELKRNGITRADVLQLDPPPKVIINDPHGRTWVVIKQTKGVKFRPFSIDTMSDKALSTSHLVGKTLDSGEWGAWSTMDNAPDKRAFLMASIAEEAKNRAIKSADSFAKLYNIVRDTWSKVDRERALLQHSSQFKTIKDWRLWFDHIRSNSFGFGDETTIKMVNQIKKLPVTSLREGLILLEHGESSLSKEEKRNIVKKIFSFVKSKQDWLTISDYTVGKFQVGNYISTRGDGDHIWDKILRNIGKEDLKHLKGFLTDQEYKEMLKRQKQVKREVFKKRLRCLRKQLRQTFTKKTEANGQIKGRGVRKKLQNKYFVEC